MEQGEQVAEYCFLLGELILGLSERFNKIQMAKIVENQSVSAPVEQALALYSQYPMQIQPQIQTPIIEHSQNLVDECKTKEQNLTHECKENKLNSLISEFYEKIANIPCWYEYNYQTQNSLIIKFLEKKNIKEPEVFAKFMQSTMLGFGVFDIYLKKATAVFYKDGEPLSYIENGERITEKTFLHSRKIHYSVKNIINLSLYSEKMGIFSFRTNDYWVNLRNVPNEKLSLSIHKITDDFLLEEARKANVQELLADFDMK